MKIRFINPLINTAIILTVLGISISLIFPRPLNNFTVLFYIVTSLAMLFMLLKNSKKFLNKTFKDNYPGGLTAEKFFSPIENICLFSSQVLLYTSLLLFIIYPLISTVPGYKSGLLYLLISFHILLLTPAAANIKDSLIFIKIAKESTVEKPSRIGWIDAICSLIIGITLIILNIQNFLLAATVTDKVSAFLATPLQ